MSLVQTYTSKTRITWELKVISMIRDCRRRVCLSFSPSSRALSSPTRYPSFHGGILRCSCQGLIGCQRLIGPFGLWRSWQQTAKTLISTRRNRHLLGDRNHLRHRRTCTQPHTEAFEIIKVLQSHRRHSGLTKDKLFTTWNDWNYRKVVWENQINVATATRGENQKSHNKWDPTASIQSEYWTNQQTP